VVSPIRNVLVSAFSEELRSARGFTIVLSNPTAWPRSRPPLNAFGSVRYVGSFFLSRHLGAQHSSRREPVRGDFIASTLNRIDEIRVASTSFRVSCDRHFGTVPLKRVE